MALEFKALKPGLHHADIGYGWSAQVYRVKGRLGKWGFTVTDGETTVTGYAMDCAQAKRCADMQASKQTVKQINMMSQKEFDLPITTPWCCNPASETYWSM